MSKIDASEMSGYEVGLAEVCTCEVGTRELRFSEPRIDSYGAPKVRLNEVRAVQARIA